MSWNPYLDPDYLCDPEDHFSAGKVAEWRQEYNRVVSARKAARKAGEIRWNSLSAEEREIESAYGGRY